MKLEDATSALKKVEGALSNILLFCGKKPEGHSERQHQRYTRRSLIARYIKIVNGVAQKDQVQQANVLDVSAGGMRIAVSVENPLKVKDHLSFSILKENSISILKGLGHVVRVNVGDEFLEVAIQFETVKR